MGDFINIKNYDTYLINNNGEIKDNRTGKIMPQHLNHFGYRKINLVNPEGNKCFLVHRLVALQFIKNENPDKYKEVDHINRKKTDNNINNLRWADDFMNAQNKGNFKNNKLNEKYIHFEEDGRTSRFVFQISRNKIKHKKSFNTNKFTLEDAIKYKNEFIKHSIENACSSS